MFQPLKVTKIERRALGLVGEVSTHTMWLTECCKSPEQKEQLTTAWESLRWAWMNTGLPRWFRGKKKPACQCRRHKRCRFNPWVRKLPWRRAWQPIPVFLPGEFPWTEEPDGLVMGSQRVGHDWAAEQQQQHVHWVGDAIQASHPLSSPSPCPQSFPASPSFPMCWLFASGGQNIGASILASVLPMKIEGWFPLQLIGLIALLSKGLSRVFSSTIVRKHQFFSSLFYCPARTSLWEKP